MTLQNIATKEQLAAALGVIFQKHLVYYLYRMPEATRYTPFEIKKRSGGTRTIHAPHMGLKVVQRRLAKLLSQEYGGRGGVHGYISGRSIKTNASEHSRHKQVLNIDLKDFFASINFGRVRGILKSSLYGANDEVATVIAQLCCHQNQLPQGAPTSPVISNMVCGKLDAQLKSLAKEFGCTYTRYSDDLTFSCQRELFPEALAIVEGAGKDRRVLVGDRVKQIILENGFLINDRKTRLLGRSDRQEVTGLVVNRFVNVPRLYIRDIRAAIHAWRKHGYEAASETFRTTFDHRTRESGELWRVLMGRIQYVGSIRGFDDEIYRRFRTQFNQLGEHQISLHATSWEYKLENGIVVFEALSDIHRRGKTVEDCNQGTAFFLKGVGIVTCAHCVGNKRNYIYHPSEPTKTHELEVLCLSEAVDLAVLRFAQIETTPPVEFDGGNEKNQIQRGDRITLAGWPSYGPGSQLSVKQGVVQSIKFRSGIRRFNISAPIIDGNSGGPVFNSRGQVIGVAATGANSAQTEQLTEAHGVIPIDALKYLQE